MFGCPADQIRSFSETVSLIPDSEDDDENCAVSGRILTAEEFIERFKNREDIFSIDENIRLNSSEIIALLCAILACSTCGKENIKQTNWSSGLPDFSNINISDVDTKFYSVVECRGERIPGVVLQSQLCACKNYCLQNIDTTAVLIEKISENGLNIHLNSRIGYNKKASLLSSTSAPRGPPLQILVVNEIVKMIGYFCSLKCKNTVVHIEFCDVFTKNKVDTGSATLIGNSQVPPLEAVAWFISRLNRGVNQEATPVALRDIVLPGSNPGFLFKNCWKLNTIASKR